ncbi:nuclear transport factor 2 family protein [Candidatus Mycobacterium methanotrophicum]|uniref:Nuclear transport factor 2 family protein n=1 Tax=Candidatus Mycobacterium methanotrophicum TaxID=2943498 RepID=A0ABY4QTA6_9MYCO|nr:nuclear transport factor 2 family protein [Candidatus Mycobacterium methanotrophicum]UQX13281.1 nuclear transport factor 2 family protein [Candidatus Mycobacterium methanotrophicum]
MFAAFWAVGYWPGDPEPARGAKAYTAKVAELLATAPDRRLEVVDSASVPGAAEGEQLVFLRYIGRATGPDGPVQIRGIDRVRTRNGMVVENVTRYEPIFVGPR